MKYLNLDSGAAHFISPAAAVKKTIAALEQNETFYGEPAGLPALQQALVSRYAEDYQVEITPENILITAGTKQALFNLFFNLLKPGDEVILPLPSWFGFTEMLDLLGVKTVSIETNPAENYDLQPEALAALITPKTRLFIFSNPGNPSGRLYSKTEIAGWLQVLEKHPLVNVLSDEIYDLIVYDKAEIPCLLQFPDPQEKFIVVNGFSKNFGMSGWRIGYILAPKEITQKLLHYQQATISGVNPFIQEGAVAALQTRKTFLPERIAALESNREILSRWLDRHPQLTYFRPQGAYYIFADLNQLFQNKKLLGKGLTSETALLDHLKTVYRLEFQPGEKFNCPGFIRITFALPEMDLEEALNRLDSFLNENSEV